MRSVRRWTTGGIFIVAVASGAVAAPEPPAQSRPALPAASQSAFDQQRFNDLIALIEGQNSPQARRTGARELLRHQWPETVPRLRTVLSGPHRPAKVAVALALSDLPHRVVADYVEPLFAMLADPQAEVRHAATVALATNPTDDVLRRLKSLVLSTEPQLVTRLAAIDALGLMTRREAVAVLIAASADQESPIAGPALAALERATAQDFQGSFDAALAWWEGARQTTLSDWRSLQIERLVRQRRATRQRVQYLEQRLTNALRENYFRMPESERPALLNAYLNDVSATVRRLGLELVQSKLAGGKALAPETAASTRELLSAPDPLERAAAVRTVATLRDPTDGGRFQQLLASERHGAVREALVNGLGYVGSTSAAAPLLELLESPDRRTSGEAVTALGRLAERGVLDEPTRTAVASALLARMQATPRDKHAMRDRLLWAMSRVGDRRFGAEFVRALDTPESATVRQAAVRGIAVLADPKTLKENGPASQPALGAASAGLPGPRELLDALAPITGDPDAGVRRAVIETLAQFGTSDAHVEALWSRLPPGQEPDEGIRTTAWRGSVRLIAPRPVDEIEKWLDRLPEDGALRNQRAVELLQAAEKHRESRPDSRGELGRIRVCLAARRAALNQIDQALSTYLTALEDLHAARSPQITDAALELLRLALLNNRYDAQLAAALAQGNPGLDGQTAWEAVRAEIEQRVQPDEVDRAIAMLIALQTNPPASMPADTRQAIEELLQRARAVRAEADVNSVKAALAKLLENPEDEQARQEILKLGSRATAAVRDALHTALQAEQPDANEIQRLHDLLKGLVPEWAGFDPDATGEEKLNALDAMTGE